MLTYKPAVFAVERNYQILALTQAPCLFWVEVDGQEYYDESNGILRSLTDLHRVNVPMDVLDRAGSYRVCMRPMQERKAYFSRTGDVQVREFPFRKLPDKNIRAYHISDAHNRVEEPVRAAAAFGPIDLLILNGDLLSHCDEPKEFSKIYRLAEELTG